MTNIIMNGYNGKMGKAIINLVNESIDCQIVAGIDAFATGENLANPFQSFKYPAECSVKADVIIDFSHQSCVDGIIDFAVSTKTPLVLCTTGLTDETLKKVEEASKEIAILKSANMSLGINLISSLLGNVLKGVDGANFDIEIIEKHHNQKVDAPSGTALLLADQINKCSDGKYSYTYDRTQKMEKRKKDEIGFSVVRGGSIVGEHSVLFIGKDEVIDITHIATSKEVFAVGAVKAARYLNGKTAGRYDMGDVVNDK